MIICPKCGNVLTYNSYFGGYLCSNCNWENTRYYVVKCKQTRRIGYSKIKLSAKNIELSNIGVK